MMPRGYHLPIIFMSLLIGCNQPSQTREERTSEIPWVMRSVLDQQTRMVTLDFSDQYYAAYNTEYCRLYKVWKGGVHWDGANFNNIKTIQPESWGKAYYQNPLITNPWKIIRERDTLSIRPQFKGYILKDDSVIFKYELTTDTGRKILISENPALRIINKETVQFSRRFIVSGLGKYQIINGKLVIEKDGESIFKTRYDRYPKQEIPSRFVSGSGSQYWLDRSGCNTCHKMNEKTIGPSYRQISQRYQQTETNLNELVKKVKNGGSGIWGDVPMQPHPDLSEEVIQDMVYYILSIDPSDNENEEEEVEEEADELVIAPQKPGFGAALLGVHPSLVVETIHPSWFKPRVGGMDFLPDGRLVISTWDSLGAVYTLKGVQSGDTSQITIHKIAEGLAEPLGLKTVDDEIYVLQKQELTRLVDHNLDGITDEYQTVCDAWGVTTDFHEFSYGLEYKDGYFYAGLGLAMRLMPHELQNPDRGTVIKIAPDGKFEKIMTGLRQTNGIGYGPDNELFITENQGQWVPACKLIRVEEGTFHGCQYGTGDRYRGRTESAPAVWLPQDEIGNSPGQPISIPHGMYSGQMLYGEVTHGGMKRVFLEKVNGDYQGVGFRFTQGLEAGIIRSVWGPDSALYVGGIGMNGNWGWNGKQYGLQRITFSDNLTFEVLKIEAKPEGFLITFTEPLRKGQGEKPGDYFLQQWHYDTTPAYGSPKLGLEELTKSVDVSQDRKQVLLTVQGLKPNHVVYFLLDDTITSMSGKTLWTGEAWYTLNAIPDPD